MDIRNFFFKSRSYTPIPILIMMLYFARPNSPYFLLGIALITIGEMIIEGSNGTLRLNGNGELFKRKFGSNKEFKINYKWDKKGFAGDSVFKCKSHILDYYINEKTLYNSANDYLENLKIEEYIYKSNSSGKIIKIK